MQKMVISLWFNGNAEEAVNFYVSTFQNAKINQIAYYTEAGPGEPGSVLTLSFSLDGQEFIAINAGDEFQFTPAISILVNCDSQAEVDYYWEILAAGGEVMPCGWVTDRYGLTWQIVPAQLDALMTDPDPKKAAAVTRAMLQMVKLDMAQLQAAYDQV
jgi:predicted 3-demethylubiquinone-9 3-methyltransferase (glyoxalase superfamily)